MLFNFGAILHDRNVDASVCAFEYNCDRCQMERFEPDVMQQPNYTIICNVNELIHIALDVERGAFYVCVMCMLRSRDNIRLYSLIMR